jgi:NADPH:quinone reductase-like Zn-dependent oxidoreductase
MKAVAYTEYGPPDILQLTETDKPIPAVNEVLIRVQATEATKSDCEMRCSKFAVKWFWLPLRLAMGVTKPITIGAASQ